MPEEAKAATNKVQARLLAALQMQAQVIVLLMRKGNYFECDELDKEGGEGDEGIEMSGMKVLCNFKSDGHKQ